jgi:hypothetical protein
MPSIVQNIKDRQLRWASERGIAIDQSGYTLIRDANLFVPLCPASVAEFDGADGGELGKHEKRGKINALHSSSALAANAFEFWRDQAKATLQAAMGLSSEIQVLNFEKKFPTGLPGNAPNLDVVLTLADQSIVAIESKFLEPFGKHTPGFKEKYFEGVGGRWSKHGYAACQRLAEDIQSGSKTFQWLHPEQLLKHVLGLSNPVNYAAQKVQWRLIYLCFDPGVEAVGHMNEAQQFADIARSDGIDFHVLTYQTLIRAIRAEANSSHTGYLEYFEKRYFA